jgi:DNA-damage-inducible protein J
LGYNAAQKEFTTMTNTTVVPARIDERTKRQAAAALKNIGLTVSDAFRLLMVRIAAEKALPFEPLNPNAETIAAMKAARRGDLIKAGKPKDLLGRASMREIRYTARFKRDYRREKSSRHGKKLDALVMEVVNLLASDTALPRRNFDHPLSGEWSDHRDCHNQARSYPDLSQAGQRHS